MGWYARGWSHRGEGWVAVFASACLEFRRLHRAGVSLFARGVCFVRRGCVRRCAPPFHPRPSHCSSAPPLLTCPSRLCRLPRSVAPPNFAAVFPHGAPLPWVWLRSRFLGDRLSCEARLLVCVWCPVVFVGHCVGCVCLSSSVVRLFPWAGCWRNLLSGLLYCEDGAKCVYIFEQDVLQQALEKLTLEIQESKSLDVGNNQMVAFVCLKAPPCGQYSMLHQKKIFGDYKLTSLDALESARLATLLYLQEMGIIFVDDINLSEVTKYEIKLAECQQKLLAASNFTNMFQQEIESLKTKLDSAYQENQKLAVATKALIPPAKDVKKEESTSETFNTTKQVCTPPSIDHRSNHRLLQHRKRSSSHDANVKRTILKTLSTADSKPQSSNSGNASHSTDSVEYGTN